RRYPQAPTSRRNTSDRPALAPKWEVSTARALRMTRAKLRIMRPFTGYVRRTTIALAFAVAGTAVHPQSWQPPADSQRCPSKWGAGDQRGSGNHMKPETVLRAVKLIRTGEVIELGHVLNSSM